MIGILCAMEEERDAFRILPDRDEETMVVTCGLGKVNAAIAATKLMERYRCRALICCGTAGGLRGLRPMDVLVALEVIQHDYGRSAVCATGRQQFRPGVLPIPENRRIEPKYDLPRGQSVAYQAFTNHLPWVRYGLMASGDTFVNDTNTREALIDLGALAVDMESGAVAQVAESYGVPWAVVKGVSDDANHLSHEEFQKGLRTAAERAARATHHLIPALTETYCA